MAKFGMAVEVRSVEAGPFLVGLVGIRQFGWVLGRIGVFGGVGWVVNRSGMLRQSRSGEVWLGMF